MRLKDWEKRPGPIHSAQGVVGRAFMALSRVKDAIIFPIIPPSIPELGTVSGFYFQLQDKGGVGHAKLIEARDQLLSMTRTNAQVANVRVQGMEDAAQMKIDLDEDKAGALGMSLADINTALQTCLGSLYVNNFVNGNRVQQVIVQLEAAHRMLPEDIGKIYARNKHGDMIPLSTKNAILIIEFAKGAQAAGKGLIEATLEAVHLRLRPILMTSLAFVFGVLPLAISHGAGSASQHAIGTGVAGGMITATVLAIFMVPVFFVVVRRMFKPKVPHRFRTAATADGSPAPH